jgi:acyl dehydratase
LVTEPFTPVNWDLDTLAALEFPIAHYEVSRAKILEYNAAIGDVNPVHNDPVAAARLGYRDLIAPPTFPAVFVTVPIRQAMVDATWIANAGLDPGRVLHGEQRFEFRRPVVPGDKLLIQAIAADASTKGDLAFVLVASRVDCERGERVLDAWSTLVLRP